MSSVAAGGETIDWKIPFHGKTHSAREKIQYNDIAEIHPLLTML
jgi:hypothetical protein